jgi:hypothetical protein
MRHNLIRKESPDESWRKGLLLSPPRKTPRRIQSAPPRLGVRFAPESMLIRENIDFSWPLCEEELKSLWYTKEEYALMKRSTSFTVRLMMGLQRQAGSIDEADDEEICTRGLESRTRTEARKRRHNIFCAIDAVMLEQERQRDMSSFSDIYTLARVYRDASAQCSLEAWLVAQKDAKAVEVAYEEPIYTSMQL